MPLSQVLARAVRGLAFAPFGAMLGAMAVALAFAFTEPLEAAISDGTYLRWLGTTLGSSLYIGMLAGLFAFLIALVVTVPLLTFLIYLRADHWLVCMLCGLLSVVVIDGVPIHLEIYDVTVLVSGAAAGLGAWYGSRQRMPYSADDKRIANSNEHEA